MIKKRNLDASLVSYIDGLGMGLEARGALGGTVYYVEGNDGSDEYDGLSVELPFKTLAKAITVSHADIDQRSRWAKRNTIYIYGDRLIETLTAFPQKTDIVGQGSCDNFTQVCLRGNHAPVNTAVGTRFFNVQFEPTSAAVMMTLTSASTGIEFHNCTFEAWGAAAATSAINTKAHAWLKVVGCEFNGEFSDAVIQIEAGDVNGMKIIGNTIMGGAENGIDVVGTTTVTKGRLALIADNEIYVAEITINDGADSTFLVMDNTCVTAGAYGGTSHVITVEFAGNNVVVAAGTAYTIPDLKIDAT